MKKKVETKKDSKEFKRFDNLLRHVVKVPKDEILKREKAEKKVEQAKKKGQTR